MKSIKNKLFIGVLTLCMFSSGISIVYAADDLNEPDSDQCLELNEFLSQKEERKISLMTHQGNFYTKNEIELTLGQVLEVLKITHFCFESENIYSPLIPNVCNFLKQILLQIDVELDYEKSHKNDISKIAFLEKKKDLINEILIQKESKLFLWISKIRCMTLELQEVIDEFNAKLNNIRFYTAIESAENLTLSEINEILKNDKTIINENADQAKYELLVHTASLVGINYVLKKYVNEDILKNIYIFYAFALTLYEATKKYRSNKIHEKFSSIKDRMKVFLGCFFRESSHFASMLFIMALDKCLTEEQKESIKKMINAKTLAGTAVTFDIINYFVENNLLEQMSSLFKQQALLVVVFKYLPVFQLLQNMLGSHYMLGSHCSEQTSLLVKNGKEFIGQYAQKFIASKLLQKAWQVTGQKFINDDVSIDLEQCNLTTSSILDLFYRNKLLNLKGEIISEVLQLVEDYAVGIKTRSQQAVKMFCSKSFS